MRDVLIIGGGVAGGSAAIYTAYAKLSTLVLDTESSQLLQTQRIRNYPGIREITGEELKRTIQEQAISFGAEWKEEKATEINPIEGGYAVKTEQGGEYRAKALILATNLHLDLLEQLGFTIQVNPYVPSGKVKEVVGVSFDGKTSYENLFIAGLNAGVPSQSVIAAGQGVKVAVDLISKLTGKKFMWHDK
ncbi:NAD(P)/FAD-dependent oxidoreductase [Thermicanus aegyptius]|uniref:NAD(P)/FAD-dependent oxidoreductase n=1 Tax=Thermicanus aegyptius TaxID=94009 RepID=UPI000421DAA3|nr:FAD-dependent oxidoreductase [Thermicanus aegyptius]